MDANQVKIFSDIASTPSDSYVSRSKLRVYASKAPDLLYGLLVAALLDPELPRSTAASVFVSLFIGHFYRGDITSFSTSSIAKELTKFGHNLIYVEVDIDVASRTIISPKASRLSQYIKKAELLTDRTLERFITYLAAMMPKLMISIDAVHAKVVKTDAVLKSQGIPSLGDVLIHKATVTTVRAHLMDSFPGKYLLIKLTISQVSSGSVCGGQIKTLIDQARMAGLVLIKLFTDHLISGSGGKGNKSWHPILSLKDLEREAGDMVAAINGISAHGDLAPFARILGLSGVEKVEYGKFPKLAAVIVGIGQAHNSSLNLMVVGAAHKPLCEAARLFEESRKKDGEAKLGGMFPTQVTQAEKRRLADFHKDMTKATEESLKAAKAAQMRTLQAIRASVGGPGSAVGQPKMVTFEDERDEEHHVGNLTVRRRHREYDSDDYSYSIDQAEYGFDPPEEDLDDEVDDEDEEDEEVGPPPPPGESRPPGDGPTWTPPPPATGGPSAPSRDVNRNQIPPPASGFNCVEVAGHFGLQAGNKRYTAQDYTAWDKEDLPKDVADFQQGSQILTTHGALIAGVEADCKSIRCIFDKKPFTFPQDYRNKDLLTMMFPKTDKYKKYCLLYGTRELSVLRVNNTTLHYALFNGSRDIQAGLLKGQSYYGTAGKEILT
ncbi:nucleoprotein [Wenling frogfish filovirus]|uniref:Nucleoprotein n=1 Tax=Wenling frogfish filovirus TaxID=2116487 RepID=A0A2P1GML8_9MONO|nr:nucleoprotein [Wenling frogfish filovirus]AVM87232.1 nucleoprotein [Wenling frogfish filovirus]